MTGLCLPELRTDLVMAEINYKGGVSMDEHEMLRQGDLISVNFSPSKGHEQQKQRPAVVISNNFYNSKTWMKKLLPVTSTISGFPMHYLLPDKLPVKGEVMLEQEKCLDLSQRPFKVIGRLPKDTLDEILALVHDTY